jgi:hypothetical protein
MNMNFSGINPEIEGSARRCIRVSVRELEKRGDRHDGISVRESEKGKKNED